ncbi:MAG: SPASM domain-containing protein [Candidatus Hodarchaeales archaeon]
MLESPAQRAFGKAKLETLPRYCRECEVKAMCNGACPKDRFLKTRDGEQGLNYLCAGYKRFFTHCQPFVSMVAVQSGRETRLDPVNPSG